MAMLSGRHHPAMIENVGRMGECRWAAGSHGFGGRDTRSRSARERARNWALRARTPRKSSDMAGREIEPAGPQDGQGFYDYDAKGKRSRLCPTSLLAQRRMAHRCGCRRDEARFSPSRRWKPRAASRRRDHRSARCRCRRDPRLGFAPSPAGRCLLSIRWAPPLSSRDAKPSSRNSASASGPTGSARLAERNETFYARFAPEKQAA